MRRNCYESGVNISTNLLTISLSSYLKGVVATIRSFSSLLVFALLLCTIFPAAQIGWSFDIMCGSTGDIGSGQACNLSDAGGDRFRGRFSARDPGRLRRMSSECVRLQINPLACLDERNSSVHSARLPTVTSSDRTRLAHRRGSVSFLNSLIPPHHRHSEGGSTCRLGYGNVPY